MFIDFHAHILPNIDDGPQNTEISLQVLKRLGEQGINTVIATPHYYSDAMTIDDFLSRRGKAYQEVVSAAQANQIPIPKIILGAEVHLTTDIAFSDDICRLAIENTNCILIEMPFGFWHNWVLDSIYHFISGENPLIPVIAHIERYIDLANLNRVNSLLAMDVYTQINTSSFYNKYKSIACALYDAHAIHLVGTDCHNTTSRPPDMDKAQEIISKKYGETYIDFLMQNASALLRNELPFRYPLDLRLKKKWFFGLF